MYKLTEIRFKKAKLVLEKFRTELHNEGITRPGVLEKELRECWGCRWFTLKQLIPQLSKIARYRYLAAYYMEHIDFCVSQTFKPVLAELYGIEYYDSPDMERKKAAFWKKLKAQK